MADVGFESILSGWTVGKAILTTFGLLTLYIVGSIFYNLFLHPLRKYPGPKLWAISRLPWNWVNLHGRLAWRLRELHQQYGPVVRIAPDELSYTTSGAWKKIYGQRNPEFSKALDGRGLAPPSINGIKGIVTEDQDRHARLRRAIAPAFSERALRDQEGYLQAHTKNLMSQLRKRCHEGPLDMVKWYSLTTFDVISDLAFGQPAGCLNNADQPWLQVIGTRAKSIVWFQLAIYYGFFNFMNWMAPKYTVQARQKHIELTSAKVQQRLEKKNPGKDFMSYIVENKTEQLSNLELVIMASSFIVAGSGTGASALTATTNFLLRNRDKLQRLVDEVRGAFASDDDITMQSTSALKYLTACIDESMRLYPPAPSTLPRFVPPGGDEIDGRWVPAGTAVGVHQFSTGHMTWNFARASEFIPERWLELPPGSEFANDDRAAIQPFSFGSRNCIGKSRLTPATTTNMLLSSNITTIVPAALLLFVVVNLVDRFVRRLRISRKAAALGCLPVPVEPTRWPLGIDMVLAGLRADREQRTPDFVVERFNAMGPRYTWRLRILGTENFITAEPKNVQAVLATQFGDFIMGAARRTNLKRVLGRSIFAVDGAAWHAAREVVRPIFSRENVSDLALLEQHFRLMLQCMPIGDDGWTAPVNLAALFPSLTIDSSTELFLGKSTHSLLSKLRGREEENNFHEAFERVQQLLGIRMRLRSFYWLYGEGELSRCIGILHAFVDKAMSEAQAAQRDNKAHGSHKKYDFLNTLISRCSDAAEVREHVLGLLAAGRDTTASLMSWTFYCLIRSPRVFAKLRGVVLETFGPYREEQQGSITFEKLKGCAYLQHVMNETLRLHSIVPFNSRCAVRDTTLPTGGGPDGTAPVFVPAGTEVNFSTHVMHRRHDLWGPDADEFVPERWEKRRPGWTYAPFNV
ncbi:cytochrome P450 71A23 [Phyllosticta citribraziliensis]|uniref:Cytochrome P450 71A23 n=1 Tax=Phyllosticta citribraziliensis TaxID=989973 RepID=A0ABR1LDE8_9PEZI